MNSIPIPLVVAFCALGAAFLAGLFSLVGLILSKDMKVSDARLQWNEALREDLGEVLGHLESLLRLRDQTSKEIALIQGVPPRPLNDMELAGFRRQNKEHYLALNVAKHRLMLRLNKGKHPDLMAAIHRLFVIFDNVDMSHEKLLAAADLVAREAHTILAITWREVETGERAFYLVTRFLFLVVLAAAAGAIWLVVPSASKPGASATKQILVPESAASRETPSK